MRDKSKKVSNETSGEILEKWIGINAVKKVIPIDISEQEYKKIIDLWNR